MKSPDLDGHGTHESDVFLSYRGTHLSTAETVATHLKRAGIATWLSRRRIAGGADWDASIRAAVVRAKVFVALTSADYRHSAPCRDELDWACDYGKQIICVGESPADWPDPADGRPTPRLPAATVVVPYDLDHLHQLVLERVDLGGQQAHLEAAAAEPDKGRSSYRGRTGLEAAQQIVATLHARDLPVSPQVTAFIQGLRRRRRRFLARVTTAAAIVLLAGSTIGYRVFTDTSHQTTDRHAAQAAQNDAVSRSEAARALRLNTEQGSWDNLEALRTAADAYDHSATAEATVALRTILAGTPQVNDLVATKLDAAPVALRFTGDGTVLALSAQGNLTRLEAASGQTQSEHIVGSAIRAAWLADTGTAAIALSSDGELRYWTAGPQRPSVLLGRGIGHAAASDDLRTYVTAHSAGISIFALSPTPTGPKTPRCLLTRPLPVTALAISADGDTVVAGDQAGDVIVIDAQTCGVGDTVPHFRTVRLPIISIDVANGARAVSYTDHASTSVARLDRAGRYAVSGFTEESDLVALSADGTAALGDDNGAVGDPLDAVDFQLFSRPRFPLMKPAPTMIALHRRSAGVWDVALARADAVMMRGRMLGALNVPRPPAASSESPDAGDRRIGQHPLATTAQGLAMTGADTLQAGQSVDVTVWRGPEQPGVTWKLAPPASYWSAGARWLAAPRGNVLAVARAESIAVLTPDGALPPIATGGVPAMSVSGTYLFDISATGARRWKLTGTAVTPMSAITFEPLPDASPVVAAAAVGDDALIVARRDGTLQRMDATTGMLTAQRTLTKPLTEVSASPDGRHILAVDVDGLHLMTGATLQPQADYQLRGAFGVTFAPDSAQLAVRTGAEIAALTVPELSPTYDERIIEGPLQYKYPTAFADAETLAQPDGSLQPVCEVCAHGDGRALSAAAERVLTAARLGGYT